MNFEKLQADYQKLLEKKKELTVTHKSSLAEMKELELIRKNMGQFLDFQTIPNIEKGNILQEHLM